MQKKSIDRLKLFKTSVYYAGLNSSFCSILNDIFHRFANEKCLFKGKNCLSLNRPGHDFLGLDYQDLSCGLAKIEFHSFIFFSLFNDNFPMQ